MSVEPRTECPVCRVAAFEAGYGCHVCDHLVRENEMCGECRVDAVVRVDGVKICLNCGPLGHAISLEH
jgi:hypothetical protein